MAYGRDFVGAARRHLRAAQTLYESTGAGAQPGCRAIAGYLFGLAGELAMKQMMRDSGVKELPSDERRDDPFYAHFPALKSLLSSSARGRRENELRKLAENPKLFQHWDTDMRYAPTQDVKSDWVDSWKESAEDLVGRMDLP